MVVMCNGLLGVLQQQGELTEVNIAQGEYNIDWWFFDTVSYVNGGITEDISVVGFTATPMVDLTIQLSGVDYASNITYDAQITALDQNSITIRVNKNVNGTITEAATGDVIVHIWVAGTTY
jgi:F420-0:gamma-glutamyl ligase-like protein